MDEWFRLSESCTDREERERIWNNALTEVIDLMTVLHDKGVQYNRDDLLNPETYQKLKAQVAM